MKDKEKMKGYGAAKLEAELETRRKMNGDLTKTGEDALRIKSTLTHMRANSSLSQTINAVRAR